MPFHPASAWGVISLVAPPTHDRGLGRLPTGTWAPAGRVGRQVNGHMIRGWYMVIEFGTSDIVGGEWKMTERWDSELDGWPAVFHSQDWASK